jgi:glutathione synthase
VIYDSLIFQKEWELRLMVERSKAIKAPKIEYQLIDCKKFQQFLYETDTLETLLKDRVKVDAIRDTFVKQFSFGNVNYWITTNYKSFSCLSFT